MKREKSWQILSGGSWRGGRACNCALRSHAPLPGPAPGPPTLYPGPLTSRPLRVPPAVPASSTASGLGPSPLQPVVLCACLWPPFSHQVTDVPFLTLRHPGG